MIAAVVSSAFAQNYSASRSEKPNGNSDKARLVGAWHLVSIAGPDGKLVSSVQLMYPTSESALSNQYVQSGYEASFGNYDVDEARHMLTHHVQGSVTRDLLVGKDLPRLYEFTSNGQLMIKSARPNEHWSVTWEHY